MEIHRARANLNVIKRIWSIELKRFELIKLNHKVRKDIFKVLMSHGCRVVQSEQNHEDTP